MEEKRVWAERLWLDSSKTIDEVIEKLGHFISRPNMAEFMRKAADAKNETEIEQVVSETVGPAGLMEFLRLPLGSFSQHNAATKKPRKMVRMLVGNPLIMQSMARHVPEVGSYAPVTILVFEREGGTRIRYDRLASFLGPYGSKEASEIARHLDEKVENILMQVAS